MKRKVLHPNFLRDQFFIPVDPFGLHSCTMNDLYKETIEFRGRTYHYDPDRDIFYAHSELTAFDRWGWIFVIVALSLLAWYLSPA